MNHRHREKNFVESVRFVHVFDCGSAYSMYYVTEIEGNKMFYRCISLSNSGNRQ